MLSVICGSSRVSLNAIGSINLFVYFFSKLTMFNYTTREIVGPFWKNSLSSFNSLRYKTKCAESSPSVSGDLTECGHHLRTTDRQTCKRHFPSMSAFSTFVENADALENAQKMRKNVQIRNSLSCPHFPLL